jgi:lysophospholipase L1-like esterase
LKKGIFGIIIINIKRIIMAIRICVFGDSIAWGAGDEEGGGWVDRFKIDFKKVERFNEIFNLGNSGESSTGLLERIKNECQARMKQEFRKRNAVIIQTGINDSRNDLDRGTKNTSPEQFEKNIQEIARISKRFVDNVIFVGLAPIEEERANLIPWGHNVEFKNKNIREYENIIQGVCERNKIHFIGLFEKWKKIDYSKLLEDGLHPNSEGHKKIFEVVREYLIKNKII